MHILSLPIYNQTVVLKIANLANFSYHILSDAPTKDDPVEILQ